jgi:RHS repeat-associated protein
VRPSPALGRPVAERTPPPAVAGSTLNYTVVDPRGTVTDLINATTGAVTHRYTDPFGNPRGTTVTWPDTHGYLNAPTDPASGLTHLGARDYQPTLGRFLSVDPLLDTANPQTLTGYCYSANDPVNSSDPSGLRNDYQYYGPSGDSSQNTASVVGFVNQHPELKAPPAPSAPPVDLHKVMLTYSVPSTLVDCQKGITCSTTHQVSLYDLEHPKNPKNYCGGLSWLCTITGYNQLRNCIANPSVGQCLDAIIAIASDIFIAGKAIKAVDLISILARTTAKDALTEAATETTTDAGVDASSSAVDDAATACTGGSFTPNTSVVMANGSTKPLNQIQVGDQVEATDPATGAKSAQTVTAVWINHDTDLMNVTVTIGGVVTVIHATQHHLFWDNTRNNWTEADNLTPGDQLHTDNGQTATVVGTVVIPGAADMWDLTITTTHDFNILLANGSTAVLVHNNGLCLTPWGRTGSQSYNAAVNAVREGGTIESVAGTVATETQATQLIEDPGGTIPRGADEGHLPPNPHTYPHINYWIGKVRGTVRITGLGG